MREHDAHKVRQGFALDQRTVQGAGLHLVVDLARWLDQHVERDVRKLTVEFGQSRRQVVGRAGRARAESSTTSKARSAARELIARPRPASVSRTPRPSRSNRRMPTARSKLCTCWVTAPWVRGSESAARETGSCSATARKDLTV